ncbi:hypothetical protein [Deinococcus sp. Leaf326]|uniref:hypothetical protein n=1 Tax=Deinococcus sp. Leaf326 TaxID=1736338 RepID=UPI0007006403|nr:hypothetical protein [Deinococcus sp. Leaf326]KQR07179.1 hypothetical protein ASF71_21080 [Deinococcus sp. Leaf326]
MDVACGQEASRGVGEGDGHGLVGVTVASVEVQEEDQGGLLSGVQVRGQEGLERLLAGLSCGVLGGVGEERKEIGVGGVLEAFRAVIEGPEEAGFVEEAGERDVQFLGAVEEEGGDVVEFVLMVRTADDLATEEGEGDGVEVFLKGLTDGMEVVEGGGEILGDGDGAALEVLGVIDGVNAEEEEVTGEEDGVALFWGGVEGGVVREVVGVLGGEGVLEGLEVGGEGLDVIGPAVLGGMVVVGEGQDVGGLGKSHIWSVRALGVTREGSGRGPVTWRRARGAGCWPAGGSARRHCWG